MGASVNVLVWCKFCLWVKPANKGDLIVTRSDKAGNCISHEVKVL